METGEQQRAAFATALAAQIEGINRAELAAAIAAESGETMSTQALGHWLAGTVEPSRPKVFAAEKCLGLPPGSLSRHFGYVPVDADLDLSVEAAIKRSGLPRLTKASLLALIEVGRRG